jgi:DNA-binding beta-propeller fold protein YncE
VLGALVLAAALAASPGHARLVPPAAGLVAGHAAIATVVVSGKAPRRAPRIRFAGSLSGQTVTVAATKTARRGTYQVRFTLPLGGRWTYRITAGRVAASGNVDVRVESRLPGAQTSPICAGAGSFWPTETLAVDFGSQWVACKQNGVLLRVAPQSLFRLGGSSLIAVTSGFGSVWALDGSRTGLLLRIDPGGSRVSARIDVGTSAPYNVWAGAGSVWVAGDQGAEVVRVDPATNSAVAHIPVGDGPADIAFDESNVYVIDHRDRTLFRIDERTNQSKLVGTIPGDAPERMVFVDGRLWITGRGTDLLEVEPSSGNVLRTVEIGAGGIDVVASGSTLWVPSRNADTDARGFPTMEALRRVDAHSGIVTSSLAASAPLDVHGLAADDGGVWLADNTHGVLYRVGR